MAVQQLVDYIKKQLARGVGVDALKKVLTKEGWQPSDVESSLKEAGAAENKIPAKYPKVIIVIAAAVFLIVVALAGFYIYKRFSGTIPPEQAGQESGAPLVEQVKETVVKKIVAIPVGFETDTAKMAFDRDGSKVGFVARDTKSKSYFVFLNESKNGPYDEAYAPVFSADGSKFAYTAKKDGKEFIVVDGVEGAHYQGIGTADGANKTVVLGTDGSKTAYIAQKNGKYIVVVNGREGKEYDYINNLRILSGQRINYRAKLGEQNFFVINEEAVDARSGTIGSVNPYGGQSTAKTVTKDNKQSAVINGKESRSYDSLVIDSGRTFLFSRDDKKVAYIAKDGGKEFAVVNGVEGKYYNSVSNIVFSTDSQSFAYVSTTNALGQRVVVDEKEIGNYYELIKYLAFGPDNKPVFIGATSGQFSVVYDGKQGGLYEYVGTPFFGSDGKLLFGVKAGNLFNLVTW